MSMFDKKNIYHYLFAFSLIVIANYFGKKVISSFETQRDEYELIKKYLLNDESHVEGSKKPKIWIHSKYEINARKWKDFYSRNTTDLNQPYIHLTIKTIIDHCGDDFNVCLIDDETFSKIIPNWDISVSSLAEPMKSNMREYGMMQILNIYGGMIVPNTFICTRNLKGLYDLGIKNNVPFICENVNHSCNLVKQKKRKTFIPDTFFMGSKKNDPIIKEFIAFLENKNYTFHISSESIFLNETAEWCINAINNNNMTLIDGELIGIKNIKRKPILLEDLMEEHYLELYGKKYGIYIPGDQILKRHKYQWFAVLPTRDILKTNAIITKHLIASISDGDENNEYSTTQQHVTISV